MAKLHIYISSDKFRTEDELNSYLIPSYTEDGDLINSPFMKEVKLENYEPMCVEVVFEKANRPVKHLLEGISYYEQWVKDISDNFEGNVVVCIYEPNLLANPMGSILNYLGEYSYDV